MYSYEEVRNDHVHRTKDECLSEEAVNYEAKVRINLGLPRKI